MSVFVPVLAVEIGASRRTDSVVAQSVPALFQPADDAEIVSAVRAKSDLNVTLSPGSTAAVAPLLPPSGEAYLFSKVTILQDIDCHLATAHLGLAGEPWAVLSNLPPTLATFGLYGQRFGGIVACLRVAVPHLRITNQLPLT